MTIQQIIDEQMREFDKKFVVECPTGLNKGKEVLNPMFPEPIKSFLSSYTRKLIEALGEEIMDVAIDQKDECPIVDDVLRQQRLKLKEIISSLE